MGALMLMVLHVLQGTSDIPTLTEYIRLCDESSYFMLNACVLQL